MAPGVIARQPVKEPLQTGIKAIDAMIPIGRGQRELIIGDRKTGKTAIAIDTIINQKDTGVKCFYVAIGQKESTVAGVVEMLAEHGAMDYTTVIVAGASDPAPLQYIAPYAGTAMAEYFTYKGEHALIVYDDLVEAGRRVPPAVAAAAPPAGPRGVSRATCSTCTAACSSAPQAERDLGGGSLTALPIIETLEGEVSAYIPTNVISITDGQIYLQPDSVLLGRPPGDQRRYLGVAAWVVAPRSKPMKKVAGGLRLELAQFRELEAFAQFGTDLDADTQKTLARGTRLVQALNQGELKPLSVAEQVVSVYAGTGGSLDHIKAERVQEFLEFAVTRFHAEQADLLKRLDASEWGDDIEEQLGKTLSEAIDDFGPDFDEEGLALEEGESERVIGVGHAAEKAEEETAAAATA